MWAYLLITVMVSISIMLTTQSVDVYVIPASNGMLTSYTPYSCSCKPDSLPACMIYSSSSLGVEYNKINVWLIKIAKKLCWSHCVGEWIINYNILQTISPKVAIIIYSPFRWTGVIVISGSEVFLDKFFLSKVRQFIQAYILRVIFWSR